MDRELALLLSGAPAPDEAAENAVRSRAERVLRPRGALARLDEIAIWLARWQRSERPAVERPAVLIFVGEHGVAEEGVSAYPPEVTASVLAALRSGVATANAMARTIGATLRVVDAGVGRPTANFLYEPALSESRFRECFELGRQAVASLPADLVVLGEMGIGNTTAASAVAATLFGSSAEEWTGRGTGVDGEAFARKVAVVEAARARIGDAAPLQVLRQAGGTEMAAIAGAVVEARIRSLPVVLDGFVVTAAVAPLELAHRGALDHCVAGHCSSEPGHGILLDKLGKRPILELELRLGEGSGAMAAVPLIKLAVACVVDVATFAERGLE